MNPDGGPREFTTTRWSVVLRAGGSNPEKSREALEILCRDYWFPLYAFVRRRGSSPEDAADLTQEFFARLLARDFAQSVQPEGGRFRSFLLTALNRFLINEWQKAGRKKRGGGAQPSSLEALIEARGEASYVPEASHEETPERHFNRAWAETLLARVLERLAEECSRRADVRFEVLRPFLSAGGEPPSLSAGADQLGLSLTAFKSLLHRFRQRYREILLDEVGQTVGSTSDVADELRDLLKALRS